MVMGGPSLHSEVMAEARTKASLWGSSRTNQVASSETGSVASVGKYAKASSAVGSFEMTQRVALSSKDMKSTSSCFTSAIHRDPLAPMRTPCPTPTPASPRLPDKPKTYFVGGTFAHLRGMVAEWLYGKRPHQLLETPWEGH
jgi:hypothetical protein